MSEKDLFAYMMAAEKMGNLVFTIVQTLEFLEEYELKPEEDVRKILKPVVERLNKWIDSR